jgi:predicted CoA-substrate-specific enzyme activase
MGQPARQIMQVLAEVGRRLGEAVTVDGVGTTGSGRNLAAALVGGDVVKNEITAHAVAALRLVPEARTVLEIGGQDSKVILLREGVVVDFAMNTVCAAGTGSFLDRQASRLGLDIREFGRLAAGSTHPVRIAGRCTVFAETDMIHKQQVGHPVEDIVAGLCRALVRNYLNNLAKGKDLEPPYVFQGGVAANAGMVQAFEEALGAPVFVPEHHALMGAYGAAILALEEHQEKEARVGAPGSGGGSGPGGADRSPSSYSPTSRFRGFRLGEMDYRTSAFDCEGCTNQCEIVEIFLEGVLVARWGGRCDRWERAGVVPGRSDRSAAGAGRSTEDRAGSAAKAGHA